MIVEQLAPARAHVPWHALREQARAGRTCRVRQATSADAPGRLASVAHHRGAQHSPALFPGQHALSQAVAGPIAMKQQAAPRGAAKAAEKLKQGQESLHNANDEPATRGPGRPPKAIASLEQVEQEVEVARHEPQRLAGQCAQVTQRLRAIGHACPFVDLARGVRRTGKRMAGDIHEHIDTIRSLAQPEGLSEPCMDRIEQAERVVPKMQAPIACVSGSVRQQGRHLDVAPPVAYAMHAHLMLSFYLDRVASTRTMTEGEPLRALAERLRTPLCAPGGVLGALRPQEQHQPKHKAQTLAEVCQRSSSHVEGRNGSLALRHHQLRGLDHPRKRACLTTMHHFFLTRADGTTATERFFGQKPRSMFAAILASVDLPPAPRSPLRQAVGEAKEHKGGRRHDQGRNSYAINSSTLEGLAWKACAGVPQKVRYAWSAW